MGSQRVGHDWGTFTSLHPSIYGGSPGSSAGKESTCNPRDLGWIPGLGRFSGEGIGYPFQYSWASLVAQRLKRLPAMRETGVRSLGWEAPLEKEMATHASILAWRICPWREEPSRLQSTGSQRVGHDWASSLSLSWRYYFKYFFSFFLSFFSSGIPITCMFSFCNCLSFRIFCFIHFIVFSLSSQFCKFILSLSSSSLILSFSHVQFTDEPIKHIHSC